MDEHAATQLLEEGMRTFRVPGAQLGLLHGDDRLVVCGGVVSSGGPFMDRGTAFHAGSLAKSLAGLVTLGAARRGCLDLDAPATTTAPTCGRSRPAPCCRRPAAAPTCSRTPTRSWWPS